MILSLSFINELFSYRRCGMFFGGKQHLFNIMYRTLAFKSLLCKLGPCVSELRYRVHRAVAKVWLRKELRSACHHRILPCILGPRPSFHNCMNEWLWMDWKLRSIPRLRVSFLSMPLPLVSCPHTDILENIISFDITLELRLIYFGCLS